MDNPERTFVIDVIANAGKIRQSYRVIDRILWARAPTAQRYDRHPGIAGPDPVHGPMPLRVNRPDDRRTSQMQHRLFDKVVRAA